MSRAGEGDAGAPLDLDEARGAFRDSVRAWVEKNFPKQRATELERREYEYPFELWDALTQAGYHGMGIDERYGGQGGDTVDSAILARELARNLGGLTWTWAISSFAGAKAIAHAGTEEQRQHYLPRLAAGKCRFAIASPSRAVGPTSSAACAPGLCRPRAASASRGRRCGRPALSRPTTCCFSH